jgi:twitching motility protein PilT
MPHPQLDRLLHHLADREGGTDLHLKVGSPPRIRVKGALETVTDEALPEHGTPLDKAAVDTMAAAVLTQGARDHFMAEREAECTYSVHGLGRFRVSAYLQRGSIALILRRVTASAHSFADLGLPPTLSFLAGAERGLVLVAGPASSGVTTTLAAMVDHINHARACHIVTVEDPVEILHKDDLASISQRQVGVDTTGLAQGIRSALRQDPDVVVIGRIDSLDVAAAAVSATEAGCLVLAGVRAGDACDAISQVVNFSAESDQRHARLAVAGALVGAVSQRLVPRRAGTGRAPAVEILRNVPRIQAAIMGDEMDDVRAEMARGAALGMQTLNQALATLLERHEIDERAALAATPDWLGFRIALEQRGFVIPDE